MAEIPSRINRTGPSSQSVRNIRISDIRNYNILDHEIVVSDDWVSTEVPERASATWSPALNVKGYDSIILFIDHTVGGTSAPGEQLTLSIDIQSGFNARNLTTAEWYDRYTSFNMINGDSTAITASNTITLDTSALALGSTTALFLELRTVGHYMRFRPYVTITAPGTATQHANSRVYVRAVRDLC